MRKDKPSRTAYKVALNIVTLNGKPGMEEVLPAGIVDSTAEMLLASGAASPAVVRWSRSRKMAHVYEAFDWMLPGQFAAFGHRKAFCERQVRQGIAAGATQILVLGAGYDTMGWRLAPEYPDINFFEIDHPTTARLKAKGIASMGERDNLCLIAEDLDERELTAVMAGTDLWSQDAKTVTVAEGLVMYLPPNAVQSMLRQLASICGKGSRIAFTYVPTGADGRPDVGRWTGLVLWLLRISGEPWLWSIRPEDLGLFLNRTGWTNAPELTGSSEKHGVEFYAVAVK